MAFIIYFFAKKVDNYTNGGFLYMFLSYYILYELSVKKRIKKQI